MYVRDAEALRNYSIDMFLSDIKLSDKRPIRYDYPDDKEYHEAYEKYRNSITYDAEFFTLNDVQKSFRTFKVGDNVGRYRGEKIIFIDHKRQVFITEDHDDQDYHYYYVINPDQKPSLTSEYLTNPYIKIM